VARADRRDDLRFTDTFAAADYVAVRGVLGDEGIEGKGVGIARDRKSVV
jgi:hypothetical protein